MVRATFQGAGVDILSGAKTVLTATGPLANARFWSPDDPYLYDVYTMLTVDGKVVDVNKMTTGFRKTEFKGGAGTGGVYINDKFVYLKGFAQRSSDEWAGVGAGYPEWMHDFTAQMLRDCNGNYMRWMHVAPQKVDVEAFDRFGIVEIAPAGDKEEDAQGRQWEQRVEVMRDTIIYLRNNPSILFWEAGNTGVTAAQMRQMVDMRKELDPHGGRAMGCRSLMDPGAVAVTEWFGTMLGGPYNAQMRDQAPLIETEDFRDEGARRFWDDYSPPYFGFKKGPNDTWNYNSETFALAQVKRYWLFWSNRISNTDPEHSKWSAYASIYFTDSDADGRQDSSEVCPRQRQDRRRAPAQGSLLCRARDAERKARHPHHRALDLPGQHHQDDVCHRQQCGQRRILREWRFPRQGHPAGERLCLCLPEHRVHTRHHQGRRLQRRRCRGTA